MAGTAFMAAAMELQETPNPLLVLFPISFLLVDS